MAASNKSDQEAPKRKNFRWSLAMVEDLLNCLYSYKTKMEYNNLDFDADRPAQIKAIRVEMAKLYTTDEEFGPPIETLGPTESIEDMSAEDKTAYLKLQKKQSVKVLKGHQVHFANLAYTPDLARII